MKIAVVDDNKLHRDLILNVIDKWKNIEGLDNIRVKEFSNGESFLFSVEDEDFDLILLDIIMPKIDGMKLAQKLRSSYNDVIIVFLTGEESYVYKGYKVNAFDYLLKPIKEEELFSVLNKVIKKITEQRSSIIIEGTFGIKKIIIEDILYVESQNKDLIISLKDKEGKVTKIKIRSTLENLITEIDKETRGLFSMPHRSYYCNLSKIESLDKNKVYYDNGDIIPISRNRKDDFISSYLKYMRDTRR